MHLLFIIFISYALLILLFMAIAEAVIRLLEFFDFKESKCKKVSNLINNFLSGLLLVTYILITFCFFFTETIEKSDNKNILIIFSGMAILLFLALLKFSIPYTTRN